MKDAVHPLTRHDINLRALGRKAERLSSKKYSSSEATRLIRNVLKISNQSAPQFARDIGVAPQTINRWLRGVSVPRPSHMLKLCEWIEKRAIGDDYAQSELSSDRDSRVSQVYRSVSARTGIEADCLGIHYTDSMMELEKGAHAVWVMKSGPLRESDRGFIGQSVLEALKTGTNFHYVFLPGSRAEETFTGELTDWLSTEIFQGLVTGYRVQTPERALQVGLTTNIGAWVLIEYSRSQTDRLLREFDVFKALPVREYATSERRSIKNEDGLPLWIEIATPQAIRMKVELDRLMQDGQQPALIAEKIRMVSVH